MRYKTYKTTMGRKYRMRICEDELRERRIFRAVLVLSPLVMGIRVRPGGGGDLMEERKCPVCHKTFIVPSKSKWAYKKMSQLICSWTCLRAMEMKKGEDKGMRTKVPEETKQEALRVAIAGGNPIEALEPYTRNPKAMWWAVKSKVKETDPETYAKLQDLRNTREPAKEEKAVKETKAEELPKITSPVVYDDMIVREVEGLFGRYRRSDVHNETYIDFELAESMDIMSYTVDQWRKFRDELEKSSKILGVEL